MKLTDIKGERALDVLADIIEPIANMASDEAVSVLFKGKKTDNESNKDYTIRQIKKHLPYLLKAHKKNLIAVFAALDGEEPEKYVEKMNILTIPIRLFEVLSDEALLELFTSAALTKGAFSSSAASATLDE